MNGEHDDFDARLRAALRQEAARHDAPAFDDAFAAAHRRRRARRAARGALAAIAAAAVAVLALSFSPWHDPAATDPGVIEAAGLEYVKLAELMGQTHWTAPSDVLLPAREIDMYGDLPELMESTGLAEGALL